MSPIFSQSWARSLHFSNRGCIFSSSVTNPSGGLLRFSSRNSSSFFPVKTSAHFDKYALIIPKVLLSKLLSDKAFSRYSHCLSGLLGISQFFALNSGFSITSASVPRPKSTIPQMPKPFRKKLLAQFLRNVLSFSHPIFGAIFGKILPRRVDPAIAQRILPHPVRIFLDSLPASIHHVTHCKMSCQNSFTAASNQSFLHFSRNFIFCSSCFISSAFFPPLNLFINFFHPNRAPKLIPNNHSNGFPNGPQFRDMLIAQSRGLFPVTMVASAVASFFPVILFQIHPRSPGFCS